jgi:hypothetical protein
MSVNLSKYRFERKFIVERFDYPVDMVIKTLRIPFRSIYYPRVVNNVYFDTLEFSAYKDNVFGKSNRLKIRLRWYDNKKGENAMCKPQLEYKIKSGLMGTKKTYPIIPVDSRKHLLNKERLYDILDKSDLPVQVKDDLSIRNPVLINQYHRHYFATLDGKIRITVDSSILFQRFNYSGSNHFVKFNNPSVVELKYDSQDEVYGRHVGQLLPFRLSKYSKYQVGIEKTHAYRAY